MRFDRQRKRGRDRRQNEGTGYARTRTTRSDEGGGLPKKELTFGMQSAPSKKKEGQTQEKNGPDGDNSSGSCEKKKNARSRGLRARGPGSVAKKHIKGRRKKRNVGL